MNNTKYTVEKILEAIGGLPEECAWLDYKATETEKNKQGQNVISKEKTTKRVASFLNSLQAFSENKYIIFGVKEDKTTKQKTLTGLNGVKFPDDNEWQNEFQKVSSSNSTPPFIETGTIEFRGFLFGYIFIPVANSQCAPFSYRTSQNGPEAYPIRRGSNSFSEMSAPEKRELHELSARLSENGKTYPKTYVLQTLTILGQYNESYDKSVIEEIIGLTYDEIKNICIRSDTAFSCADKSLYGLENTIKIEVTNKHERLLQFTPDELNEADAIISSVLHTDMFVSDELLDGVSDTLVFLTNNGFSFISEKIIEKAITFETLFNRRLHNSIQKITEAHPRHILKLVTSNIGLIQNKQYCHNDSIVQALRVVAWFPEFYEQTTRLLLHFNRDYCYELFGDAALTAASHEQRFGLLVEIGETDTEIAFNILEKVLYFNPKLNRILTQSYVPEVYKRLFKHSRIIDNIKTQQYYTLFLEYAGNNANCLIKLLPQWLNPYPYCNIQLLTKHLDMIEPTINDINDRKNLWYRLCIQPLVYITDRPVEQYYIDRLNDIGNKFKPIDELECSSIWFQRNIVADLCIGKKNVEPEWDDVKIQVSEKQKDILLSIYNNYGIDVLISFIEKTEHLERQLKSRNFLPLLCSEEFLFTADDECKIIKALSRSPEKFSDYISHKAYNNLKWVKSLDLCSLSTEEKVILFKSMSCENEFIDYYEAVLGDDANKYWEADNGILISQFDSMKRAFESFLKHNKPKCALDVLSNYLSRICSIDKTPETLNWLFNSILRIEDSPQAHIQPYVLSMIYKLFSDGDADDDKLLQLEQLSFRIFGRMNYQFAEYRDLYPKVTMQQIANRPQVFIEYALQASPLSCAENIINNCAAVPDNITSWNKDIERLIAEFDESEKAIVKVCQGAILWNTLCANDEMFSLDDEVANALEADEDILKGFVRKAYYPYGFHSNGNFEDDAMDRKNSDNYNILSKIQNDKGNIKLSTALMKLSKQLISSI